MVVKIRLPRNAALRRNKRRIGPVTFFAGSLLRLVAVPCLMLALWRLTSDLGWTGAFVVKDGLFSHWQVWLALTFGLGMLSFRLMRYAQGNTAEPARSSDSQTLSEESDSETDKPVLARRRAGR
jgi:hypothetical protein